MSISSYSQTNAAHHAINWNPVLAGYTVESLPYSQFSNPIADNRNTMEAFLERQIDYSASVPQFQTEVYTPFSTEHNAFNAIPSSTNMWQFTDSTQAIPLLLPMDRTPPPLPPRPESFKPPVPPRPPKNNQNFYSDTQYQNIGATGLLVGSAGAAVASKLNKRRHILKKTGLDAANHARNLFNSTRTNINQGIDKVNQQYKSTKNFVNQKVSDLHKSVLETRNSIAQTKQNVDNLLVSGKDFINTGEKVLKYGAIGAGALTTAGAITGITLAILRHKRNSKINKELKQLKEKLNL